MGEHGFYAVGGLRTARIALPYAAASLPASLLIGSALLEMVAVLSFVVGAVALHAARGERPLDAIGGFAAAAALVCVPVVPTGLSCVMVCTFSTSVMIAFLVAGRTRHAETMASDRSARPQQEAGDGIAAV